MPARRKRDESEKKTRPPAKTPEARESELVSLAHDLAEKQLRDGTASSQVQTHFLKLGSSRELLEQERLAHENELTRVKIQRLEDAEKAEVMYKEALEAMRSYSGLAPEPREVDDGIE